MRKAPIFVLLMFCAVGLILATVSPSVKLDTGAAMFAAATRPTVSCTANALYKAECESGNNHRPPHDISSDPLAAKALGGGTSFQPQPPIRAAFFYPWFPAAWTQAGFDPFTNYNPSLGFYDSQDDAVIDEQLNLASRAGLDAFIASWWGPGHHTDVAFQYILSRSERIESPNPDLRWAVYYEQEGSADPSPTEILSDLQYLADNAFSHPGYLKVNDKPVVFVWADAADGADMADRWAQAADQFGGNIYVVLKVFPGYRIDPNQPDSWHQYAPAVAYDDQLPYSATISPGFWKRGESPRLTRDPARFSSDLGQMASSGAFWHLITTWNEWGEGTSVEPAEEFGETYIDLLCESSGVAPCAAGSPTSFTFSAAGDHGATSSTDASLSLMAGMDLDFHIALGDLSYSNVTPESAWCDYVHSYLGAAFPFQLVVGNHEDDDRVDGFIRSFASCLPDRMSSTGDYTTEYYFDVAGLARFILLGAGNDVDGVSYDYVVGSPNYDWLQAAIDDARGQGIPWVIVGMHKVCLTAGVKPCEVGSELMDLLFSHGVDLVLQGHEHNYQRFKQLTCAQVNTYIGSCVSDDGADGEYTKGTGSVVVIVGTLGGGSLVPINTSDPEYGYVARWMGENSPDAGRGFVKFSISKTQLSAQFMGSTTTFSDSFTISESIDEGPDTDGDGCSDAREEQTAPGSERAGGLRDPFYFWDFIDQWTGGAKDSTIAVGDIGAVVARFGAIRGAVPTKQQALTEALTPPVNRSSYHASSDRAGTIPGENLWNLLPPDGIIVVGDIGAVVAQFGHSCRPGS